MDYGGKVAIVTGASTGIGRAVARELTRRGAKVALVARTEATLEALVQELGQAQARAFPLDVTERASTLALPALVRAHFGRLDFVINNAGRNHRGPFAERSAEELAGILDTNLIAPVLLTHAALPVLEAGGAIVNVASIAGKVPVPHEAAYSGSKSGLRAFGRALDTELSLEGRKLRVLSVCPGPVDTGFLGEDITQVPDLVLSQPMSSAEDVAHAVLSALDSGRQETDVPAISGKLATLSYLSPTLFRWLRPSFERLGARKKAAFAAQRKVAGS
jgi:short-subunit dehydrogenase